MKSRYPHGQGGLSHHKAVTVADVLAALNISPDPGDLVEPSLDTAVEDGMEIWLKGKACVRHVQGQGFSGFTAEDRVSRFCLWRA